MAKILVVDDEPAILNVVTAYLKAEGYQVFTASDGPSGLKAARSHKPDLVVLDIMLPGLDGLEVLSRLRSESDVYVILLTARTEEVEKVTGLTVGADDYVTKPFSPRELMARISAALRRIQPEGGTIPGPLPLSFKRVQVDTAGRRVSVDGAPLELTPLEFDLLVALAEARGRVLTRAQLLEKVWGYNDFSDTRVVDVHLGHLRQKLGIEDLISTVRGAGYRFEDQPL